MQTALHGASFAGHTATVEKLVEHGAKLGAVDSGGCVCQPSCYSYYRATAGIAATGTPLYLGTGSLQRRVNTRTGSL